MTSADIYQANALYIDMTVNRALSGPGWTWWYRGWKE
jgi:hypothetical protein